MSEKRPSPLIELTRARLLEFVRSPGAIFWVFVFPVLLAVGLGIAFRNRPAETIKVVVIGNASSRITGKMAGNKTFELQNLSEQTALRQLRTGKVDLLLKAEVSSSGQVQIVYRFDPTRPEARHARLAMDDALQRAMGRTDVIGAKSEQVVEKGGRYIDFLLPGLIGLNIMSSCMWGIGYAVVDARRRKLLKRFAATPMNRSHFLLSFALSRLLFLIAEVVALLLAGNLIFEMQLFGNIAEVIVMSIGGAFAFSGLALLIAARSESTEVASGWMNFAMLPMWLLSGSFFDYSRFPEVVLPFIRLLPLTALNDGLRIIINDGASILGAGSQLVVLIVWGFIGFAVSLSTFKWQ